MTYKHAIILSSFVPAHNKSPVAVNQKMLRLFCETYDKVTFISANFPIDLFGEQYKEKLTIINLPVCFDSSNTVKNLLGYIKMQLLALPVLKQVANDGSIVFFWLSGPMILSFLYCKIKKWSTVGFLYGNSKYKANHYSPFNFLKSWLMRIIAVNSDLSCVESPGVLTQWGYSPEDPRFHIMHLFADDCFQEIVPPSARPPVIGMCCRLVSNKGVIGSIEAFHLFRKQNPEYCLQIIGSGPLGKACRQKIDELGEQKNIELLGWIEPEKLPAYFNQWRALLHPTKYEGLPNSVIESMCCSTPVISSPVGGVVDVIQDEITGWFLSDCSSEGICKALSKMASSDKWCTVARLAGCYARNKFSYNEALKTVKSTLLFFRMKGLVDDEMDFRTI